MAPPATGGRASVPNGRQLARAGWSVLSSSSLPGLPPKAGGPAAAPKGPLPLQEEDGARLVDEVAGSWGHRFMHTIRRTGMRDGAYHYECLFSRPINEYPVPGLVVAVRFALVQVHSNPRLLYSFEEGDLRHEWALRLNEQGIWKAAKGQQPMSLKHGVFENYLDSYVRQKEATRARGVGLKTAFEETRLVPPPAVNAEGSSGGDNASTGEPPADELGADARAPEVNTDELRDICAMIIVNGEPSQELSSAEPSRSEESMVSAMWNALIEAGLAWDKVAQPTSLRELLANIFDAADEESSGHLPHYEVARVLGATLPGFGLEEWDIHLLMACAMESEEGLIECQPFIEAAPEVMTALRERRMAYRGRGMPGVEVSIDAVRHCFGEEIMGTAEAMSKLFEECCNEDPARGVFELVDRGASKEGSPPAFHLQPNIDDATASRRSVSSSRAGDALGPAISRQVSTQEELVGMKRRHVRDCLRQLPERLSPQEVHKIMEILPEDEDLNLYFRELTERLEYLRTEAICNGVIETDISALRKHLVTRFRELSLDEATPGKAKLWTIKNFLLAADHIFLSRLQIHVLLCLAEPDPTTGDVDVSEFLGICCVVIPHMCDARVFMATAERLMQEAEESRRRNENAELAALGAAKVAQLGQDGEEKSQENEVDQETVERTLIQALQFHDSTHRAALPPSDIFDVLFSNDTQVESCQLSDFELNGLAAEMTPSTDGEVPYVEHIKRWVPILFEIRKSPLLDAYLKEDAASSLGIPQPNLPELEKIMPVRPPGGKLLGIGSKSAMFDVPETPSDKRSLSKASNRGWDDMANSASPAKLTSFKRVGGSRQGSKSSSRLPSRVGSKSLASISTEPPPGRGFERRKKLLSMERTATDGPPLARRPSSSNIEAP